MNALFNIVFAVYMLICVGLIAAVASQTSKSEGLAGTLGGKVEAAPFLRKKTFDERLSRLTGLLAWSFLALSFLITVLGP